MSVWEFNAAVAGWLKANLPPDPAAISAVEERELIALLESDG